MPRISCCSSWRRAGTGAAAGVVITPAAERLLICGRCHTHWPTEPYACPYCGENDRQRITSFATPDGTYRVTACQTCKRYVKTLDGRRANATRAALQGDVPWQDPEPCATGAECQSSICADGYCCDKVCTGGCDACNHLGYRGRVGIFEFFRAGPEVEKIILQGISETSLRELARAQGMVTMQEDGILKALSGVTSLEEVIGVTGPIPWLGRGKRQPGGTENK